MISKVENTKWVNEKGRMLLIRDGNLYSFPFLLQTFEELIEVATAIQQAIEEEAGK